MTDKMIAVPREAVNWLKTHFPDLCVKAGLCERIAGRIYTRTTLCEAAQPSPADEELSRDAEIAGLKASIGHLSRLFDNQRALLAEVEDVCGRDGHGGQLEDGESDFVDRIRSHLAMTCAAMSAEKSAK